MKGFGPTLAILYDTVPQDKRGVCCGLWVGEVQPPGFGFLQAEVASLPRCFSTLPILDTFLKLFAITCLYTVGAFHNLLNSNILFANDIWR